MTFISELKNLLNTLNFFLEDGSAGVWIKNYSLNDYRIKVDFFSEQINYGEKITLGDRTTCNFKANENLVILECVNRLLEKGYSPENIILEKNYPLGHLNKGKLDILVTDEIGKAYLIIECKTWGSEYEKAIKKTLNNGGQLLSYFQQDKAAKYLCLYSSKVEKNEIKKNYGIIKVENDFASATNTQEVFDIWNKNFKDNGIFEQASTPYNIVIKALTKERLIPLTKDDSSRIFNQFAEILRHNVVSDKPNAFNKLITLLLCKIVDEDRDQGDELQFQWLETDTNIALQKRLNDLYKQGMEVYLTKVVTDYSDDDVEKIVGLDEKQRDIIKYMMTELRLKKNNEFAFKEVFNNSSFEDNSKVLREVVELFQPYQVRYNKKQQFLGDFFELLLNTSIKQEVGQFFTPVPVARFIVNSIPLKELMINKINKGDSDFLPYVIDYAVGSGHFLTEVMDEIHINIKQLHQAGIYTKPSIKRNLSKWSEDYDWAYNFVYGIEKDYRLVKTAKVSCFLNGDGLARIFNADGLASFQNDVDFKDKLKEVSRINPQDNQQFEVLIANPPYSVSAFRNTLKDGDKSFDLYKRLTEDSSEIECLFVERAKQLLKDGGYAGIILPNSILNNGGIYQDAREIILKYFKLIAITEFGSGTFMATGTNTVTLFLERRNNSDWQKIEHAVNTFFINFVDVSCNGIESPFNKYVSYVYKTIPLENYISFIKTKQNDLISQHEVFIEYRTSFDNSTPIKNLKRKAVFKTLSSDLQNAELDKLYIESVIKSEKEKMLYFILAFPQKTLLIKTNPTRKNDAEKAFLGYEFSNSRGHEGIKPYGAKTIQEATRLYDENDIFNTEKINSYVYNSFLGNEIEPNESLKNNVFHQPLVDMMNFELIDFSKSVSLASKKKNDLQSRWDLVKLGSIAEIISGGTPDTDTSEYWNGKINWATLVDTKKKFLFTTERKITELGLKNCSAIVLPVNTVIFSSRATIGDITISKIETATNQGYKNFICNPSKIHYEFLYYILKRETKNIIDLSSGATYLEISKTQISNYKIPLPPIEIQQELIKEFNNIEEKEEHLINVNESIKGELDFLIKNFKSSVTISSISELRKEKIEPKDFPNTTFNYLGLENIESNSGDVVNWIPVKGQKLASSKNIFKKGDLLYGKLRPYLNKVYLAEFDGICSTDILVLKTQNAKLLKHIFLSDDFVTHSSSLMKGVSLPRLQVKEFLHFKIAYPTQDQQDESLSKIEIFEEGFINVKKELNELFKIKGAIYNKYL